MDQLGLGLSLVMAMGLLMLEQACVQGRMRQKDMEMNALMVSGCVCLYSSKHMPSVI